MRTYRLAAICSLIISASLAAIAFVERAAAIAWTWLFPKAEPDLGLNRLVAERQVDFAGDCPASPSLLNSQRHEAGMRLRPC